MSPLLSRTVLERGVCVCVFTVNVLRYFSSALHQPRPFSSPSILLIITIFIQNTDKASSRFPYKQRTS